jgi:hypothetical protein
LFITVTGVYVALIIIISALGWLIVGAILWLIRKTIDSKDAPFSLRAIDFWLGTTERVIAMCLAIWQPETLPAFIGAWTAAKIAANWGKMKSEDEYVRTGQLVALIGSALSFGLAIIGAALLKRLLA